ncbi:putative serine protease PepD [Solirubrobacter pauli]|uniref:Putative serine protease PepD n=1 Tax=Solirubrobacter pauli TaxID=166793 RepID=A0A660LB77_9ACTN|nr:trypsin-like peptidase domain-containing protein [Solirubrobacter pauli]RKQ92307.1 putative serine protease PepD [Solirubrobacter pauli]
MTRRSPASLLLLLCVAVIGGLVGAGVVALTDSDADSDDPPAGARVEDAPEAGGAAERVYDRAGDSVVFVTAQVTQDTTSPFGTEQSSGEATGTGFVIDRAGTIVTNAHVIEQADDVTVKVGEGSPVAARVVGSDASTDIALLRIADRAAEPLTLADSDEVDVGEAAFAIGNPYGLDRTLTAGVVSALQRQITAPNGFSISGVIQTDAAINPGNSGGPLLDADARVVGITSQIITGDSSGSGGNVGIGFAVPSNTVKGVVAQLEEDGTAEHAYLGAQTTDAGDDDGALVAEVTDGGPAARAGLRAGDLLTELDGRDTGSAAELTAAVDAHAPGDRVRVEYERGGREQTATVTLGTQPESATTTDAGGVP